MATVWIVQHGDHHRSHVTGVEPRSKRRILGYPSTYAGKRNALMLDSGGCDVEPTVHIYPINGACHDVASEAMTFSYRDANFATVIAGIWPDPAQNEANVNWVRDYFDATAPHSEEGGYINFMAADDQDRIKANYKGNYDRLIEVKRKYDPGNLFHLNQDIKR